jgi:hypothetical protein
VDAAHAGLLVALKFARDVGGVDLAAHPPPERPWLGLRRKRRPRKRVGIVFPKRW